MSLVEDSDPGVGDPSGAAERLLQHVSVVLTMVSPRWLGTPQEIRSLARSATIALLGEMLAMAESDDMCSRSMIEQVVAKLEDT